MADETTAKRKAGTRNDDEPSANLGRSATTMVPGVPAGSGEGIDRALEQPDTDLGGGVAGDTTPPSRSPEPESHKARSPQDVRTEDKERTTL